MSTVADELRTRANALHKEAIELEALASRLDGQSTGQRAFIGDERAHTVASAICTELDVSLAEVLSDDRRGSPPSRQTLRRRPRARHEGRPRRAGQTRRHRNRTR